MRGSDALRFTGAVALLVVGAIHLQQYADFIKDVPTIGVLFLFTGLGAGATCIMLGTRAGGLAALAGIGLACGALASLAISHYAQAGLFSYREPTFRGPVLISIAAEIAAVLALAGYALIRRRSRRAAVAR